MLPCVRGEVDLLSSFPSPHHPVTMTLCVAQSTPGCRDSCVLSMPGLVVCNLLRLSQSIWGCWDPLCLGGLSKKMSWAKAVFLPCAQHQACLQTGRDVLSGTTPSLAWQGCSAEGTPHHAMEVQGSLQKRHSMGTHME